MVVQVNLDARYDHPQYFESCENTFGNINAVPFDGCIVKFNNGKAGSPPAMDGIVFKYQTTDILLGPGSRVA
jgi:hypothetical protein